MSLRTAGEAVSYPRAEIASALWPRNDIFIIGGVPTLVTTPLHF